jgi:hypothetical protein
MATMRFTPSAGIPAEEDEDEPCLLATNVTKTDTQLSHCGECV